MRSLENSLDMLPHTTAEPFCPLLQDERAARPILYSSLEGKQQEII
jgi:hypothetical protein